MKRFVTLGGLYFVLALLALSSTPAVSAAESGGVLRIPFTEPATLDPAQLTWNYEAGIAMQVLEGLTGLDQNLNTIPAIAESWSASPDAKTWTFSLRQNVFFHNGRQVLAKDFVYSWNRAKSGGGVYANLFDNIASFSAKSDFKFVVKLKAPHASFPTQLVMPIFYIIPKEAASTIATNPVGTGPFKFVKWTAGKKIVLTRNDNYYGSVAYLQGVEYRFYTDTDAEWTDFQANQLDITRIPPSEWATYKNDPNTMTHSLMVTFGLGFKFSTYPDVNVRKAFQRAIERAAIAADPALWPYDPGRQVATGVVSPGKGSYDNSDILIPYDPAEALDLLDDAGWMDTDDDGILDNGAGTNLTAVIPDSISPSGHALYQRIADDLSNIGGSGVGVSVTLSTTFGEQTIFSTGWSSDYPDPENDLLPYETNGIFAARLGYSSAAFDDALNEGRATLDETTRNAAFHDAETQLVLDDACDLPIYYVVMVPILKKNYVHDLVVTAQGYEYIQFKYAWLTQPPPVPKLKSPANGSTINTRRPTLDWRNSAGTNYYILELRQDSKKGTLIANPQPTISEHHTDKLAVKHSYFWRVRACNAEICSAWSAWWSFHVP